MSEQFGNSEQLPYTPTTEEVRFRFVHDPLRGEFSDEEVVRFNAWLAEVKAQERERIVKLIEPEYNRGWVTAASFVRHLVALIKGEEQ